MIDVSPDPAAGGSGGGKPPAGDPLAQAAGGPDDNTVQRIVAMAAKNEPAITAHVASAAAAAGGRLERLETTLKEPESIADKLGRTIARNVERGRAADFIDDAIRYTAVLPDRDYWAGGNALLEFLLSSGNQILDDPRGWRRRGYRGRNVTLQAADGEVFEVQLHTMASLDAAERTRPLYNRSRARGTGSSARKRLARQQEQIFAAVPWPQDLPKI